MVIFRADPEVKEVALIFDDGPNPKVTPKLLQVLKDKQVHANFFLIGARSEEAPEIAKLIAEGGHEIGNHTYTHKRLTQVLNEKGEKDVKKEIEQGASAIAKAAGISGSEIKFLRPPYLNWNEEIAKIASPIYGQRIMMSDLAIGDYDWGTDHFWDENDGEAISAQAARVIEAWRGAAPGTLLSFHDSSEHKLPGNKDYETWMNRALPTLEAIPSIIDNLISSGLAIKKLSDMKLIIEEG